MYILGVGERISVPVQVKSVQTVQSQVHGGPELEIIATLNLSPNTENVDVVLWASIDAADTITVDDDFACRDITLEGHCAGDHGNPYARQSAGIAAIWFDDDEIATVKREALE